MEYFVHLAGRIHKNSLLQEGKCTQKLRKYDQISHFESIKNEDFTEKLTKTIWDTQKIYILC